MLRIDLNDATLSFTEQTVREMMNAINKAHKEIDFVHSPMPDADMSSETFNKLSRERGKIVVASDYTDVKFLITLETEPHTQESLGYKLVKV